MADVDVSPAETLRERSHDFSLRRLEPTLQALQNFLVDLLGRYRDLSGSGRITARLQPSWYLPGLTASLRIGNGDAELIPNLCEYSDGDYPSVDFGLCGGVTDAVSSIIFNGYAEFTATLRLVRRICFINHIFLGTW